MSPLSSSVCLDGKIDVRMSHVRLGDRVRIQYAQLRTRKKVWYRTKVAKVLEFTVGDDTVISTISYGVLGMVPGERKRVTPPAAESFQDASLIKGARPLSAKRFKLEVCLLQIDSSSDANARRPGFDMGGES